MDMSRAHVIWVPNTGNGAAVTYDYVICIVSLQLLAELSVLFVNGLVPVLPTPDRHSAKRPALPAAGGFAHDVPLSFARSAPIVGEAKEVKGRGFGSGAKFRFRPDLAGE
jgi:hypothetical protein